jgi:hypothetical protein
MTIKAIDTFYRGYRMRSRLEARWGTFFDALGVAWAYEPEGFVLGSGKPYLPDFYLPEQCYWIDVKPRTCTTDERRATFGKLHAIATQFPGNEGFVLCGEPYGYPPYGFEDFAYEIESFDEPLYFAECPTCCHIGIAYMGWASRIVCPCGHTRENTGWHKVMRAGTPRLVRAYEMARAARFEHGETRHIYNPRSIN